MRGRKPKPTARRRLEGNPGKRRLNTREPAPPPLPASAHDTPAALANHPAAAEEWSRLAPLLRRAKQITDADRSALVALCLEWERYLDATDKVRTLGMVVKAPSGYPITNPYLSIARSALAACSRLWPELGLTPSSRSRVTTVESGGADDPFNEFDDTPATSPAARTH